jgi:transcription elongation factor Elf1
MNPEQLPGDDRAQWQSVHECPRCRHFIRLADLDLKAVTTGVVTCMKCGLTGSINIQIVRQEEA